MSRSRVRFPGSEDGVSDVVGSVLMVGITVMTATALGLMLLSFQGPAKQIHVETAVTVDPGTGGWGTGDELVRIRHLGGDPMLGSKSEVVIKVGSATTRLTGSGLGSTWLDGVLTTGEVWDYRMTIAQGAPVSVFVIGGGTGPATLVSKSSIVAAATTSTNPCATDTAPPTVLQWSQSPSQVTGQTVGSVVVTAQVTDACYGANPSVTPSLFFRITPDPAFTNVGPMTSIGANQWRGTIPAQSWSSLVGRNLEYFIGVLTDLGGNAGNSATRSVTILLDCSSDTTPPTATSLTQNPTDVRSSTTGAVVVTVVVADDCAGVDSATPPKLLYRLNDATNPAFTDLGAMTVVSPTSWSGTIPSQVWATHAGKTLQYYVSGMRDRNGNLGTSATNSDLVDAINTYTYVATNTPVKGTVAAFANAQSASDSGAEASISEFNAGGSLSTQSFNANGIVSALGWTGATVTNVQASDDVRATYSTANPTTANALRVALQDPVGSSATVNQVVLYAEVSIINDPNDQFQLQACFAFGLCSQAGIGTAPAAPGTAITVGSTDTIIGFDITGLRPGGGTWSVTDTQNLEALVIQIQQGGNSGTWRVDRVWMEVTTSTNSFSTDIQMGWTGVPAGLSQNLELLYRVTGDTFVVQVCQDALSTCGTWTTRGVALTATGSTPWTYVLTTAEYNAGAPRIRFLDSNPTGAVQGFLYLDYARVSTL